ncbi:MAG: DeoR/GlpR family DNA-binding transcription regulator [Armatimonadota bacterium]|nr:DeoR/GlpR family DNA-binding transcription regulator [Armatimonadota bacterium]MDR7451547.1 DeoR/GlpR family DNA-binding transcription regulator [Armatimonadota bacterium]MDR7467514.1 DeoR/GlpR family DNA-binding transcription regulator [Armatimonadota bacterium]MDR7494388.1 DeoR/GlpR family DNA-binding transcription regulator [Armatimonadota bacterium]MDR7499205.1 DeoR/GlpR family DNA-binding transcription regulator [Armatimonadota bacterium]
MRDRPSDRRQRILEMLREAGEIKTDDLVVRFGVSPATARRDLRLLERQGQAIRLHGGAATPEISLYEASYRERERSHSAEKRRIAAAAAALVADGQTLALTGGTTTTAVARALRGRDVVIVTNAVNIAMELAREPRTRVHLTGGRLRGSSYELVGPAAAQALQGLNVDLAFIGVNGVSVARGLTTFNEEEAEVNRAMTAAAHRVVVVADRSKLGRATLVQICPIDAVHVLITDRDAPAAEVAAFRQAGIDVILS